MELTNNNPFRSVNDKITDCTEETEKLLRSNNRLIHELAEVLLINETIDAEEINIVMQCYMSSVSGMQSDRTEQAVAVPSVTAVQPTRENPV